MDSPHKGQWRGSLMFSAHEQTVKQIIETTVIGDAIALIFKSLWWWQNNQNEFFNTPLAGWWFGCHLLVPVKGLVRTDVWFHWVKFHYGSTPGWLTFGHAPLNPSSDSSHFWFSTQLGTCIHGNILIGQSCEKCIIALISAPILSRAMNNGSWEQGRTIQYDLSANFHFVTRVRQYHNMNQ